MRPPEPSTRPPVPEGYEILAELAFDLRSAWNHQADSLWEQIDPDLWRDTGNAWLVLRTASRERVAALWSTAQFRALAQTLRDQRRRDPAASGWFDAAKGTESLTGIAFFSLEFAVAEGLPIYSGGLGNVAGDYLKSASDLGVPLVGVGLLYQQGYFRQVIDADGDQREFFPFNYPDELAVSPVRDAGGAWVRVRLPKPGPPVWLRAWAARVGHVALYLLDSNDPANTPPDRGITAQLYGGGPEVRLLQEMALGIGGWRLLRAIGLRPEVCHLNEGHAALATLERARDFMRDSDCTFEVALSATRPGNVFTTHTPVAAGFDRFGVDVVATYLGAYARDELGIPLDALLAMGRARPEDRGEPLSMAWLATRASGAVNGVSQRHGEVSRRIFQELFPRWPESEVPVGYVTNGVHVPSWDSAEADNLWTEACGPERWRGALEATAAIAKLSDEQLWALRASARARLLPFVRERLAAQLAAVGMTGAAIDDAKRVLDPDTLTIGFARRFTAYKRPALLLRDEQRLVRLLCDSHRPVQLVVAGKAHPRDEEGKELVRAWVRFARRADVRPRVVFLADYDLRLAERLVQGVDLWLNTPRPPWEACGTSGMKVLVNGGLNLSSLDGWWAEAYRAEVGWALEGDGSDDARDVAELYDRLEREVLPAFYDRDPAGLPRGWIARVRQSMSTLTPMYSANRAMREYTERYYLPAARAFARRSASGGAGAAAITQWASSLRERWGALRFGPVNVVTDGGRHRFTVPLYLDGADPEAVAVELYAEPLGAGAPAGRFPMRRVAPLHGAHGFVYGADVPDSRPASHFTPRVVPTHQDACVPLELPLVQWSS